MPTVSKTYTASGCPAGTSYLWESGETGASITKSGTTHSLYPTIYYAKCTGGGCTSPSGYAYLYTADIAANPDNYTLNIDRPYTGNFTANDGVLSPKQIFVEPQPQVRLLERMTIAERFYILHLQVLGALIVLNIILPIVWVLLAIMER